MNIEKLAGSKVKFEVTIPVETFKKAVDNAFLKKNKEVDIPGFRKGQAPRSVYEARFGVESLYDEALNEAISETYYEVVDENKINVCGYPKIDLDEKKINQTDPIHYTVTVSVYPEVELGEYKNLGIKKEDSKVTDEEVDAEIKSALERDAMLVNKENETIEEGDTAKFDFEGKVDGVAFPGGTAKDYSLVIGSHQFIPGFEEQMLGMKVNETKDLSVKFPEDYHEESLKGKDAIFTVTIHEVQYKELPELNEEWVKEQKHKVDDKEVPYESVEEYKADTLKKLSERKEENAKNKAQNELFEKVIANAKFELPEDLVEDEVNQALEDATNQARQYGLELNMLLNYMGYRSLDDFKAYSREQSVKRLSLRFVLKAIAEKENFEVTEEELEKEYSELAEHYKMTVEDVKNAVRADAILEEVKSQKAYKFVEEKNPFTE